MTASYDSEGYARGMANGFRTHGMQPTGLHAVMEFCSACCPHIPLNLRIALLLEQINDSITTLEKNLEM
uniref:Uncharacterized protein n=1 Tax=Trichinella nativa TaxID=6335 RepID=A0A0V1KJU0_9BILA